MSDDKRELPADGEEPEAKRSRATDDAADPAQLPSGEAGTAVATDATHDAAADSGSATMTTLEPPTAAAAVAMEEPDSAPATSVSVDKAGAAPMPSLVQSPAPAPAAAGMIGYAATVPQMVPPPPAAYPTPGMWAQNAFGSWPGSAGGFGGFGGAAYGGAGGQVCKDFANGVCNRGSGCKFLHVGGSSAAQGPGSKPPCKDFQNGLCNRGANCKFAHEPGAAATGGLAGPAPQMPIAAVQMAPAYGGPGTMGGGLGGVPDAMGGGAMSGGAMAGAGAMGGAGSMSGGVERYGVAPQASTGGQVCKDYLHGRCARGANCRFVHEGQPVSEMAEQPVCKDFQNGMCSRGAGCRYKHVLEAPTSAAPMGGVGMVSQMGGGGMGGGCGYATAAYGGYNAGSMGGAYPQVRNRARAAARPEPSTLCPHPLVPSAAHHWGSRLRCAQAGYGYGFGANGYSPGFGFGGF